ncbi:MAG: site-2 protease family protein [Elusimicrobia bacterium]|nr:site-2 protease family protein [Elusimicrobiota bacterium]
MEWIVQLPILFFSIMVHEVAHGLTALRHGDDTAKRAGRLTFNPLPHIDIMGTVLLPVFCMLSHLPMVGWAKPVPVNPTRLRGRRWGTFRVALAGPVSNLALGLTAAILFRAVASLPPVFPLFQYNLRNALLFAVSVNIFLAFFNLLPVHPLDGGKVMSGLLPLRYRLSYDRHAPYGFMIVVLLVSFGLVNTLVMAPSRLTLELFARLGLIW